MSNGTETSKVNKYSRIRKILFLLLFISLPFGCCGSFFLVDMLPRSMLPGAVDFMVNLFETDALVENKTGETLYITPITTTYGDPRVISQFGSVRQRDFPLSPNQSITLTYDSADMPLSGVAVCRAKDECKLLPVDYSNQYKITSFEDLPEIDASWLAAIQAHSENSYENVFMAIFSLAPIVLFSAWLYLKKLETRHDP